MSSTGTYKTRLIHDVVLCKRSSYTPYQKGHNDEPWFQNSIFHLFEIMNGLKLINITVTVSSKVFIFKISLFYKILDMKVWILFIFTAFHMVKIWSNLFDASYSYKDDIILYNDNEAIHIT